MSVRTVTVTLAANVAGYTAAINKAAQSTKTFADKGKKDLGGFLDQVDKGSQHYDYLSGQMTKAGLVGAAALVGLSKAAIDWETAWAGVRKTVDGSPEEMAALEGELRNLAKTLPATHTEIAGVAEAAGQLGIAREDVAEFTKTMINLGETTNLSAEEAATSLAQFMNIMGTSTGDVDRLGAAIVDLGNNGASTEKDIVDMGLRIAGAGRQIGLSETEVLAFASSLSSVGIEAEAGGSAISQFMLKTEKAVRAGGDELEVLAETAGMTTEEFRRAFETDAAGALDAFLQGLGDVQAAGGDTTAILEALGATGIRESDALRRLASAGDLLSESLETSNTAWSENTALAKEAEQRYETTASQIQVAWNQIKDAAIEAGAVILPVIADVAGVIADLAEGFGELPEWAQKGAVGVTAVATAALLLGGLAIKAATGAAALRTALQGIAATSPAAATGLGLVSAAAGPLLWGALAFAGLGYLQSTMLEMPGGAKEAAAALDELATSIDGTSQALEDFTTVKGFGIELEGLDETIEALTYGKSAVADFGSAFAGFFNIKDELAVARERFAELDAQLVQMDPDKAAAAFERLSEKMRAQGFTTEELVDLFPQYADKIRAAAEESGEAAGSTEELAESMATQSSEVEKAARALEEHTAAMEANAEQALAASNSEIAWRQSIDDATASVKENGNTLDLNSEKGRANQRVLNGMVSDGKSWIDSLKEQAKTGEVSASAVTAAQQEVAAQIAKTAREMGLSAEEAVELAGKMNAIPDRVSTQILMPGAKATKEQVDEVNRSLDNIDPQYRAEIITAFMRGGYEEYRRAFANVQSKTATITTVYRSVGSTPAFGGPRVIERADGGPIPGHSPHDRADNILVAATAGEFMINKPRARDLGYDLLDALNSGRIRRSDIKGYADGGTIGGFSPTWQQPQQQYTSASTTAPPVNLSGLSITGTLDLGGGLEGRINGVIVQRERAHGLAVRSSR